MIKLSKIVELLYSAIEKVDYLTSGREARKAIREEAAKSALNKFKFLSDNQKHIEASPNEVEQAHLTHEGRAMILREEVNRFMGSDRIFIHNGVTFQRIDYPEDVQYKPGNFKPQGISEGISVIFPFAVGGAIHFANPNSDHYLGKGQDSLQRERGVVTLEGGFKASSAETVGSAYDVIEKVIKMPRYKR